MLLDSELFEIGVKIIDGLIKSKVVTARKDGDEPVYSFACYWKIIETEQKASTWATTPTIQTNEVYGVVMVFSNHNGLWCKEESFIEATQSDLTPADAVQKMNMIWLCKCSVKYVDFCCFHHQ